MESSNSCLVVKNGGGIMKQLPIGFRFRPTDEELLIHYLRRKVFSLPLPASIVPDHIDVFRTHPSHLPGDSKEKRYFFSKRNSSGRKGNVMEGGYWKVIGKRGKFILAPGTSNQAVGLKRCLVFYQSTKHSHALKTPWIMHEFHLLGTHSTQECTTLVEMGDWVVCRIYQKKKYQPKNHGAKRPKTQHSISNSFSETSYIVEKGGTLPSNLMMEELEDDGTNGIGPLPPPPPPQDCSSSGITEVSCNELDDEKEACSALFP